MCKCNYKKDERHQEIMDIILMVSMEVIACKKKLPASENELLELVLKRISDDGRVFDDEEERQDYYVDIVRETVWKCANTDEATWIINKLKSNDEAFARNFFYGTNPNGCNISRFRSKIISKIKMTYHKDVSVEEFGNILYRFLWNEGTWSVLDSYSYKSSFFSWLESIAFHEVIRELKDMKRISAMSERTSGNTRIIWLSVPVLIRKAAIDELLREDDLHNFMEVKFVDLKSVSEIESLFHLTAKQQDEAQKRAEKKLRHRIINGDSQYGEFIIRDKVPQNITVSDNFSADFINWMEKYDEQNPLDDVFGVSLTAEERKEKVADFLYHFHETLNWSDEDRLLWQLRYIEDGKPVEVAKKLGKERSWLDTRYSRLRKRFNEAIRLWWKKNV